MLRALLFDFNGILVNDEPLHLALFQRVLAEEGLDLSRDDYYGLYLGYDDRDCFAAVFAAAGEPCPQERLVRLIARKAAYYRDEIRRAGYPLFAGGAELAREAAAAGLTLALVSGALREEVVGGLEQAGIAGLFKLLVTADDVERGKPDPEGYAQALAALNARPPLPARLIHPHECVAIEDSPAGLAAAAACGLRTLGVAHTYPAAALAGADTVIERLDGFRLKDLAACFVEG
ncbi:MAG: HAD family phosphatase [Thermoanaerobaculia bacterium]|nr:HAD family phosphatase [Thermoanaerobaculia bacterium]MBP9825882.1 HAD family phosphatase [Thermoanaerobaculia bacterium]